MERLRVQVPAERLYEYSRKGEAQCNETSSSATQSAERARHRREYELLHAELSADTSSSRIGNRSSPQETRSKSYFNFLYLIRLALAAELEDSRD